MTISECVRSSPWWGWSNLWGTIAADQWGWFVTNILELNPESHRDGVHAHSVYVCFRGAGHRISSELSLFMVESRCGAVALGSTYPFPPLSFGGASVVQPWLRFHIPLIEPDRHISRIRLSDKTSRRSLVGPAGLEPATVMSGERSPENPEKIDE
jgi:hypothetical protein